MTEHPHDLLAEYVDGALDPADRGRVERHLASCSACAAEVRESAEAREALSDLPGARAPDGLALEVLRRARERPAAGRRAGAWLAAAAALVLVLGGAGYLFTQLTGDDEDVAAERVAPEAADEHPDAAEGSAGVSARTSGVLSGLGYPAVRETGADRDADSIRLLAADLAAEARDALEAGFPPNAFSFYRAFELDSAPASLRRALRCVGQGLELDRSVVPFVLETAAFDGTSAYAVSFLVGPAAGEPYDRVQILVVERDSCDLLHFARQTL